MPTHTAPAATVSFAVFRTAYAAALLDRVHSPAYEGLRRQIAKRGLSLEAGATMFADLLIVTNLLTLSARDVRRELEASDVLDLTRVRLGLTTRSLHAVLAGARDQLPALITDLEDSRARWDGGVPPGRVSA